MSAKSWISLIKQTYSEWDGHQAPRFGASVALYSLFSFAPLAVLAAAVIALVFSQSQAQSALVEQARQFMGNHGAETVRQLLQQTAQKKTSGFLASAIAFITLLFGASGVFIELRQALNVMWEAEHPASAGILGMIKDRLFSFGMVLSVGFLLLVSLMLSAALAFVGTYFDHFIPVPPPLLQAASFLLSFVVITILFALMYKFVPDVKIEWRDVWTGAVGTALLFTIGKFLLALYLGMASVGSAYGAAGSLVAVIVWVYYSAQIFFFGAEFTHVYAKAHGSAPDSQAAPASQPLAQPSVQARSATASRT